MLVVAATPLELAHLTGADTLCCGIGPVEAAVATTRAIAENRPAAILHIGLAGARELEPGSLVIGEVAIYADLALLDSSLAVVDRVAPDAQFLARARRALPNAHVLPIATSAAVGAGHRSADVEAMEGFAVLRAAAEAGVPALEVRAISNRYADARAAWRIDDALAGLAQATRILLDA